MDLGRPLSTLELTVLGVVLKLGPCVGHAVVVEFAHSQTMAYRSGAGSVYPLLKRLTNAGLLTVASRRYSVTELGSEALRTWLRGPLSDGDYACALDELRSRVYFMRLVGPEGALAFAEQAREGLLTLKSDCEATLERYRHAGDLYSELAMRGAVLETDARIQWVTELKERLQHAQPA